MTSTDPPPPSAGVRDQLRFLNDFEARLERLDRSILVAEWNLYAGRSANGAGRLELDRARLLAGRSLERWTRSVVPDGWTSVGSRRLELLRREVTDAGVEQDPTVIRGRQRLQKRIVAFRPTWEGRRVGSSALYDVVRKDPDPRRRRRALYADRAFYRSLVPDLRRLIAERNQLARTRGYRSYAELRLAFEGLSVARLEELAQEVLRGGVPVIRRVRDAFLERHRRSTWYPWDFAFAANDQTRLPDRSFPAGSMVRSVQSALRAWGVPARRLEFRVTRHDLPFGGLTIAPHVPDDVRVLVNPRRGWEYYAVLFHEFGHAVHAASTDAESHLLRNGVGFSALHEGIADLFEEIPASTNWLRSRSDLTHEQIRAFGAGQRDRSVMRAVGMALSTLLELSLYRNPERDPVPEHHRRVRRLMGYGEYPARPWADGLMVTHPVYVQNYFLSQLFRKQVLERLREELGEPFWPNALAGRWITENWLAPGATYDWMPRLKEVTGSPLGTRAFFRFVRSAGA